MADDQDNLAELLERDGLQGIAENDGPVAIVGDNDLLDDRYHVTWQASTTFMDDLMTLFDIMSEPSPISQSFEDFIAWRNLANDQESRRRFMAARRFIETLPNGPLVTVTVLVEAGNRGLNEQEMENISQVAIDRTMLDGQQPSCSICIVDYELDEMVSQLICGHRFHPECIRQWVESNRSCPYCRKSL